MSHKLSNDDYLAFLQDSISLRRQGYYDRALEIANRLLTDRPDESSIWHTLGQIYTSIGKFTEALQCHTAAMRLIDARGMIPHDSKIYRTASLGLAQALMRYGRFDEAWPLWRAGRLHMSWSPWPASVVWSGESVDSLLVCCEGGYGDFFMFMRWLPLIRKTANVKRVGLMLWAPLEDLMHWTPLGVDEVYVIGRDQIKFGEYRASTSIMDLPSFCGVSHWEDIPAASAPLTRSVACRSDRPAFRLGFCWRAEENTSPIKTKSLTCRIAELIARGLIVRDDNLEIYSLSPDKQDLYGDPVFTQPESLEYEPRQMTNWLSTAQYIDSMDLVLTVDTAVAHLTGTLNVPALILLPTASCWRWGMPYEPAANEADLNPEGTAWYGDNVTVYRQRTALNWKSETVAIVEATRRRIAAIRALGNGGGCGA